MNIQAEKAIVIEKFKKVNDIYLMEKYKVKIEPEALTDIQEITDWYNEEQAGLGKRFQKTAIKHINSLLTH